MGLWGRGSLRFRRAFAKTSVYYRSIFEGVAAGIPSREWRARKRRIGDAMRVAAHLHIRSSRLIARRIQKRSGPNDRGILGACRIPTYSATE